MTKFETKIDKTENMHIDAYIYSHNKLKIEDEAIEQLKNAASIPEAEGVFAMPDIHTGYGVPIGCVLGLRYAISPSAVGYDINCGMRLIKTQLLAKDVDIKKLAESISRDIPLGKGKNNLRLDKDTFEEVVTCGIPSIVDNPSIIENHRSHKGYNVNDIYRDIDNTEDYGYLNCNLENVSDRAIERGMTQLGTLGDGNHFVEIQEVTENLDEATAKAFGLFEGQLVIMIHTGSRGFGWQICDDYSKEFATAPETQTINKDLSYASSESEIGKKYINAMHCAANFAYMNREIITLLVRANINALYPNTSTELLYDVTHNMAKLEQHNNKNIWVHRKGATRAFPASKISYGSYAGIGHPVIIPGSMGTSSYILVGLESNDITFNSVNHGAGRAMSRTKAGGMSRNGKRKKEGIITDERFAETMNGILLICNDKDNIKQEAPDAYKNIDNVIEATTGSDLAKTVVKLKPLAVMKG